MDILYLLVPLSVVIVFALMGLFAWALKSNQFDDLEREGERILEGEGDGDRDGVDAAAVAAGIDGNQRRD